MKRAPVAWLILLALLVGSPHLATASSPTPSTERPHEENVASIAANARIEAVSSILGDGDNSSTFGALKAIDGLEDTYWASNGEGDRAWIEIRLAGTYDLTTIGFRSTDAPDGTARVMRFTVTTDDGITVGPFDLPDAQHIYYFPVQLTARILRFTLIQTTGGNAGAIAIEAFGKPHL